MTDMTEWAGYCRKCGHPSGYHGMTFCMVQAGSTSKRVCDCDGWDEFKPEGRSE